MVNENSFTPMFLASLTVPELTVLLHDLRKHAEDREHVTAVLEEFQRRARTPPADTPTP